MLAKQFSYLYYDLTVPFSKHFLLGHTKHFAKDTIGFVAACAENNLDTTKFEKNRRRLTTKFVVLVANTFYGSDTVVTKFLS